MANMGYCRFRNTLADLRDCQDHLFDDLSEEEEKARARLTEVCRQIVLDHDMEFGNLKED